MMKVYQLSQQGTGEHVIILAPEGWRVAPSKGLPGFYELQDRKGKHAILIRQFDVQELPAMKAMGAAS